MRLTREERERILGGDRTALRRLEEPEWEEGDHEVLVWSRRRVVITDYDAGDIAEFPRQPLLTVTFREPIRHKDGRGWRVPMAFEDRRSRARFLGPQPPSGAQLSEETERGYRSTPKGAIDDVDAVEDDDELRRQQTEADLRWAELQETEAAVRRQERAIREQLKAARNALPHEEHQALLATVEREIRQAVGDHDARRRSKGWQKKSNSPGPSRSRVAAASRTPSSVRVIRSPSTRRRPSARARSRSSTSSARSPSWECDRRLPNEAASL